jgi:two-component system OmpR family response regulator
MPRRIALVEDEPAIRANYADALRRHGYEVSAYSGRREAMDAFRARLPDLAIIDIGLGDETEGGFALCRDLRALSAQLPIVFLTARDSDFDVVSGLRLGADDYLTKGVSLPHLLARIGALFRRVDALSEEKPVEERLERGLLELDLKRFSAQWKSGRIELTLTEFWIVHSLARHPGHVKNRAAYAMPTRGR